MRLSVAILVAMAGLASVGAAPAQQRFEADVRFLADDLLEGRAPGTRGYDIAAKFVAARFQALGLTPGNGTSWYQEVPFATAELDPRRVSSLTIDGRRFANGQHVLIGPALTGAAERGSAPVVFVGYGLEEPALGLDDYRGLDVEGKIVAMLWGTPAGLPSEVAAVLNRDKADVAARKGAVGLLTINTPVRDGVASWAAQVEGLGQPRMRWLRPDGALDDQTSPLRMSATLDRTAAEALLAGSPLGNGNLFAMIADKAHRPRGLALPARVSIERFSILGRTASPNVIGVIPGSDPRLRGEAVVLTAHLDHLGVKTGATGDRIYNGAMDNATGIATLLEVARAFSEAPRRPRRSIVFAAVTAEEKGLLGSDYLAKNPLPAGLVPIANVNLDMPILIHDFTDIIAYGAEQSTLGATVERAIRRLGVTLTPDPQPEQNLFTRSDHYSFVRQGVPSLFIKPGFANGGQAADRGFRSTHYHQVSDDLTRPINWRSGARFADLNYRIAREVADAPAAPLWYDGSYFGNKFAKNRPKAKR